MDMQNLIKMANRIGEFFEAMPDREEALLGIAGPRMRSQLLEHVDAENGKGLDPIVVSAIRAHRELL